MAEYRVNHNDELKEVQIQWVFHKDGKFTQYMSVLNEVDQKDAEWTIDERSMELLINYAQKNSEVRWKIVRLSNDSLAVEYNQYGFFVERLFVKQ